MSESGYIQFIYASTATFGDGNIEMPTTQRTVFQIVRKSRANNPGWGVVGALLFGDGQFIQILEGREDKVDELFGVIRADDRHTEPTVLRRKPIDEPQFRQWSMKFPTMSEDLRNVLGLGLKTGFNPHALNDKALDSLIEHLQKSEETVV